MSNRAGLTLIEVLVVVGLIGILLAIAIPSVQAIRESSRKSVCQNQSRQIALALHQFESVNGRFPAVWTINPKYRRIYPLYWQAMTLPYLELNGLFEDVHSAFPLAGDIYSHPNQLTNVPVFQCPSDPDSGSVISSERSTSFSFTDYCGVSGIAINNPKKGLFHYYDQLGVRTSEVRDGLSNTLFFGERPPNPTGSGFGPWLGGNHTSGATIGVYEPYEGFDEIGNFDECLKGPIGFRQGHRGSACSALHHWSYHPGGASFSRVDGSTSLISYSIDPEVLKSLSTRDGGEPMNQ